MVELVYYGSVTIPRNGALTAIKGTVGYDVWYRYDANNPAEHNRYILAATIRDMLTQINIYYKKGDEINVREWILNSAMQVGRDDIVKLGSAIPLVIIKILYFNEDKIVLEVRAEKYAKLSKWTGRSRVSLQPQPETSPIPEPAPVEEAPVEEAPVEEAPVEEQPAPIEEEQPQPQLPKLPPLPEPLRMLLELLQKLLSSPKYKR